MAAGRQDGILCDTPTNVEEHCDNKKSRIRETPTLSIDADSRTDTILERLRNLPIRTEKRTWSTQKCGLGPH